MDPVEERDIEKVLEILDDPRVIDKIAQKLVALPPSGKIVPRENVVEPDPKKEDSDASQTA